MKKQTSISVFMPAFNEDGNIAEVVLSIDKYLDNKFYDYEIIVVNDGSDDDTKKIVEDLKRKKKNLRLVNHKENLGYGAALRSGFKASTKELIFYTDADNQFDIKDLDRLLPLISKYDIVAGVRENRQDPIMRLVIATVYNLIIRLLLGLRLKDIDCAFKLYRREVIDNIVLKANTGLIDAELLKKAQKRGYKIAQVGVRHFPRLKGTTMYEAGGRNKIFAFVRPKVILDILKEIRELWGELQ